MALPPLWSWAALVGSRTLALYGDGAIAHAGALIARGADPYGQPAPGTFVAAIYPPVAYLAVAAGEGLGPFVGLRIAALAATIATAVMIATRARPAPLSALALGMAYLATYPVQLWAGAHRPDDLAVLFTSASVIAAGPTWRRAGPAGLLAGLAIFTKQTALLPLAFVQIYLIFRERRVGARFALATGAALLVLFGAWALFFDPLGLLVHVIRWNVLPYSVPAALAFAVIAVVTLGPAAIVALRTASGRMRAYVIGAIAVVLLAGRDGSSVNFLLDLSAASFIALASAPSPRGPRVPLVLSAQILFVFAVVTFGPFHPEDLAPVQMSASVSAALSAPGHYLTEDAGILVVRGIEPDVDDVFIWSHLVAGGVIADAITQRVCAGDFAGVVSSVPLDELDRWPVQRERWLPALARAVVARYRLAEGLPGAYRYVPAMGGSC